MKNLFKGIVENMLSEAGVKTNTSNNPGDIKIYDDSFYKLVLTKGNLGLGESYMKNIWDCKEGLDVFYEKILSAELQNKVRKSNFFKNLFLLLINQQTKSRASKSVTKHYDKGDELYKAMLDTFMMYSCGYWKNATNLEQAQKNKLELICKKLNLQPGQKILDIGCGWGGFAKYAAENYKASVVGVTLSMNQFIYAKNLCRDLSVEILLKDYREVEGKFDHIVSIGMFEHVGQRNYQTYFNVANRLLKKYKDDEVNHLFLLHTIGSNTTEKFTDPWIEKYIFPGSHIPSLLQISKAMEGKFLVEDLHSFGRYYDKTLMAWQKNFSIKWGSLSHIYDEEFYRMWNNYLSSCAAAFRVNYLQLWQFVLSAEGVKGGYKSIR